MGTSKCIGKEVATKYFLPGDLKLNLSLLGFPNYLYWCVGRLILVSCFCSEFIGSKQKKGRRKISGRVKMRTLAWQAMLGSINLLQKQDTKINLHITL